MKRGEVWLYLLHRSAAGKVADQPAGSYAVSHPR